MNYIKEINAFYDLMEREPLSGSAVNLWHALMHINNKAAWIAEFTVPSVILKTKGGLSDSSFKWARTELEERGFITCRPNGSNSAPFYKMIQLYKCTSVVVDDKLGSDENELKQDVDHSAEQQVNQYVTQQVEGQTTGHMIRQTEALIKQKETKQNQIKRKEGEDTTDAIRFYQENFGAVSPYIAEELLAWIGDFGDEFVIEAMKRSLERGKFSFGYTKAILNDWVKQGIRSVEMLKTRERNRKNSSRGNWKNQRSHQAEVVPEWFTERKRNKRESRENVRDNAGLDATELLKEYLASGVL